MRGTESMNFTSFMIFAAMVIVASNSTMKCDAAEVPKAPAPAPAPAPVPSRPQCNLELPTLNQSSGIGSVVTIGGLKAYVSGPLDSKRAILLGSDVYGYSAPKLRKIADKVAAAGYFVVVPDFFYGDPYDPTNPDKPMPVWRALHDPAKAFEDTKPVIEALKSKGISAIGAAGFCYGGKVVVELAKCGLVQAAVLLHPSFVTVDDIKEVKVPIAIFGAEYDGGASPELLKTFEEILSTKPEVPSSVKVFPGVCHGWTVRYKLDDPKGVKAAKEAHKCMLNWLIKYVN